MNLQLPRVTEVLVGAGLIDTTFMTEAGRERGTAVHLACQYLDENDLDMDSVDPALVGYLDAYRDFRQQVAMDGSWIEMPQQDPKGMYRGTPDRILVVRPRGVYDLKSGAPQHSTALQLAAYVHMMPDEYSFSRYAVYLKPTGKYSVKEYPKSEYARDLAVFMAALTVFNFKKENGKCKQN